MESTTVYIPIDRRQAIARGEELPDRTSGAALFADISGFTPFTTTLLNELGPKRGPEELTRQLNLVYDALIAEVHRFGGSVMIFSGDAITCWLDGDNGLRAIACGLAMQKAMEYFSAIKTPAGNTVSLGIKVAIATGPVRRFRAGDPQIQYIDALTGATLEQMVEAEHHAQTGEVVAAASTITNLVHDVEVATWREKNQTGDRFAVVSGLKKEIPPIGWTQLADNALKDQAQSWLLPPVYERLNSGQGRFLAELRPTLALFLRFSGIDYDQDEAAGNKLDEYVRWVQNVLARYEAYLLQLTIGDKGSYLYAAFGAPVAHEDDAERAMSAALELRHPPASLDFIDPPQIGISHGQMLTGAYGGTTRCTYGVLGDEVNMAARLMQAAEPGQVLVSQAAQRFTADDFVWSELPPLKVKGKTGLVTAFSLEGQQKRRAIHLQESEYALPMVGREAELAIVQEKLDQAQAGHGQLIGITAEAGMGKSRLVAEIIRIANDQGLIGYGGECQSFGTNISYLVWQPIWQGLLGIDPGWDVDTQIIEISKQLMSIDPALVPRLPLLGTVLNLPIPDNELTQSFDAKLRKSSLESLLVECLRAKSRQTPLLLVLEDCHWLDPLSHDLLEIIARAIVDLPVLLVMNYRPPDIERLQAPRVSQLSHFTAIELHDFSSQDAEHLITLKLDQLFNGQVEVSAKVVEQITARAEGNPFYIEELLNYLQVQGFDPRTDTLLQLDLPTSLHSLILSRIDQLTESQKSILKVASVIGRLFRAAWLWGVSPELGEMERIKTNLEDMSRLDLTPMDTPEPELTYLFKHVITQEVAYESLPFATRALLHDQLAQFIEKTYQEQLTRYIDLLAFHYDRSENEAKKREYLLKAGEAAQADYANQTAIDYFRRVLPLLDPSEQITVMRKLGDVLQLVGQWDEAREQYEQALALAENLEDKNGQAWCQTAMGSLLGWKQGQYAEATHRLEQAQAIFEELDDQAGLGEALHRAGILATQQGDLDTARTLWEESLAIRYKLADKAKVAALLSNLGIVARLQGDYHRAKELQEESLKLRYELGDKWAIANSLNNLGNVYLEEDDYLAAGTQLEVAVDLLREIGDRQALANAIHSLGNVTRAQGNYETTQALYNEGLAIVWELGDQWLVAHYLEDIGGLAALKSQPERALRLAGAATGLRQTIGSPLSAKDQEKLDEIVAPARQALNEMAATIERQGTEMPLEEAVAEALQID